MKPNLILTGFMGVGKTCVGRVVAERLGREFVDIDQWIATRAGKTVSRIFADEGEERFREWEAEACAALSEMRGLVIATGGWTLGTLRNRAALQREGRVLCLSASVDAMMARVSDAQDRPLLSGDDRRAAAQRLLHEREEVYRSFAWQVDTTRISIEEVATRVVHLWHTIDALDEPDATYLPFSDLGAGTSILLGTGIVAALGALLRAGDFHGKAALVSDAHVGPLHGASVEHALRSAGIEVQRIIVPAGEASKTLDSLRVLYDAFVDAGLERGDRVVALGGGMVSDLAGFAAATYMRGIAWVCVPTSLLGLIDASVGGKVGVDLPAGKNLAGAFYPPQITLGDLDLLKTLPEAELRSGMAEVIKAGLIGDRELFESIESGSDDLRDIVRRALRVKIDIVREDAFETGRRAALNLGHTIGHGIEAASNYALRHGEAIGIGLVAEALLAERIGLARVGLRERVEAVVRRCGLPWRHQLDVHAVWSKMQVDKKKRRGRLKFALPREIGDVLVGVEVEDEIVREVVEDIGE